jgi:glycosyltransferase involved in cell wall biosynthesis
VTSLARPVREPSLGLAPGRRLRIAHIVTKLAAGAGGITLRGAMAADPTRYASTILAAEGGSLVQRAEEAGIEVVELRHMPITRGVYPHSDYEGFRELASHLAHNRYDIVHTHSAKAGGIGRLAARRVGISTVVHSFHGFPFHEFQSLPARHALIAIERRLARMTDYFVTDGTAVAAEAVRLRLAPPDRIRAISSPIDAVPPATAGRRAEARRALGLPADAKVIGTAARLDDQKSPLDMVNAVAALDRTDVVMLWIGDGHLRAKTETLIRRLGIGDRFRLAGERSDVPALLPAFDVFAMSSLYEGLPCAVVEAMACGVPVVATAVNSVHEIVIPGRTGLLARPGDPASLSRALGYMLDHPAEAARMAAEARRHIGDRFTPAALARDMTEAYDVALGVGRATGLAAA